MKYSLRRASIAFGMLVLCLVTMIPAGPTYRAQAQIAVSAAVSSVRPDLTVGVSLNPPFPQVGEPVQITLTIRNLSGVTIDDTIRSYLYIDPPQVPPLPGTPYTYPNNMGVGVGPNSWFSWSKGYTFTTSGMHRLYVVVDPLNTILESDETNNTDVLSWGAQAEADRYEPDNTCAQALEVVPDGRHIIHNLNPTGDEDWFKVAMIQGLTYTITASNVGNDGDIVISNTPLCEQAPKEEGSKTLGNGYAMTINAKSTGTQYFQVVNVQNTGTDTRYDLDVTARCIGDTYEPDNTCDTAREVTPGDAAQSHLFCYSGDEDWMRFDATPGQEYIFQSSNLGAKAHPVFTVANSCTDRPLTQGKPGEALSWQPDQAGTFYLKIANQNASDYGANASYQVAIVKKAAQGSNRELDNQPVQATALTTDGTQVDDRIAQPGDQDWFSFQAAAGSTYRIVASGSGQAAHPNFCLFASDGSRKLGCASSAANSKVYQMQWTAASSGKLYIRVKDADSSVGGTDARYQIAIKPTQNTCDLDNFENDNTYLMAREILLGGTGSDSWQMHTICPGSDVDFVRFHAVAGQTIALETGALGLTVDTVLTLIAQDGHTELASNDDYGPGTASRIVWQFTATGDYYLRIGAFDQYTFSVGSEYGVRAYPSSEIPETPPTPVPLPFPTPTPVPNDGARTVIVTNLERFKTLYSPERAEALLTALRTFAGEKDVQGILLDLSQDQTAAALYQAWIADPVNNAQANLVSDAIRAAIMGQISTHPGIEYILVVGDDRVVPFRRIVDQADKIGVYESSYDKVSPTTTVGSALKENCTLSDDFYASRSPRTRDGVPIYVPDFAIGRLVEAPEDIAAMLAYYSGHPRLTVQKAMVVSEGSYQFMGNAVYQYWQMAEMPGLDGSLMGNTWGGTLLNQRHTQAQAGFDLQAIGVPSWHYLESAPDKVRTYAQSIYDGAASLRGKVVWNIGYYSGLNVPASSINPLDLPEAFAHQGAYYFGVTGIAMVGSSTAAGVDRVMANLAEAIADTPDVPIGKAWMSAKRRYFNSAPGFEERQRKAMNSAVFYGLPMVRVSSVPQKLGGEPFPSVQIDFNQPALDASRTSPSSVGFTLSLPASYGAYTRIDTPSGSYYTLDQQVFAGAGMPLQPVFTTTTHGWAASLGGQTEIRGILWTGGRYLEVKNFQPSLPEVVPGTSLDSATALTDPMAVNDLSETIIPLALQLQGENMAAQMGQYVPGTRSQLLFSQLSGELTFGDGSADKTLPEVTWLALRDTGKKVSIKAEARDDSGIQRILASYSYGDGLYSTFDLTYNAKTNKWTGDFPSRRALTWFIQVLDKAGNIRTVNNWGSNYEFILFNQYIPALMRR